MNVSSLLEKKGRVWYLIYKNKYKNKTKKQEEEWDEWYFIKSFLKRYIFLTFLSLLKNIVISNGLLRCK